MPYLLPDPDRAIWTFADLEALPDRAGYRYEILHGELLVTAMPSGGHQGVVGRLFVELAIWCRAHTGWQKLAPGGVYMTETTWLEPDIAIYPSPEFDDLPWQEMPPPLLVVEVLSKSTARRDRHRKRPAYLAHGVKEVWLVDHHARTIERWTSASEFPEMFRGGITWTPDAKLPPCVVTEAELFGPVRG